VQSTYKGFHTWPFDGLVMSCKAERTTPVPNSHAPMNSRCDECDSERFKAADGHAWGSTSFKNKEQNITDARQYREGVWSDGLQNSHRGRSSLKLNSKQDIVSKLQNTRRISVTATTRLIKHIKQCLPQYAHG
jgi:hypothetical protein